MCCTERFSKLASWQIFSSIIVCVLLGVHLDIAEVSHPCVCLTFFGNDRINSVDEKCDAPHNDYMDKFGSEMRASRWCGYVCHDEGYVDMWCYVCHATLLCDARGCVCQGDEMVLVRSTIQSFSRCIAQIARKGTDVQVDRMWGILPDFTGHRKTQTITQQRCDWTKLSSGPRLVPFICRRASILTLPPLTSRRKKLDG